MIDINAIINTAITNAVNAAVEAKLEAIHSILQMHANSIDELAKQAKPEVSPVVDMDALRELVTPLVGSMVEAKIEEAISAHCEDYNHDRYDNIANEVDDLPDFDDFVRGDELDSNVRDAVRDLTFEVSVS
jgi:fumarylacetoacetate (FAA) hydrolase family protein